MSDEEAVAFEAAESAEHDTEALVANLLARAIDMHASDLYFNSDVDGVSIWIRRLGQMLKLETLGQAIGRHCVTRVKAMASLDLADRRHPHDGRWFFVHGRERVDLRISTLPTLHGEDLAIRILQRDAALESLEKLGFTPQQKSEIRVMLDSPSGLVIVTGPTGSGKTTTLYAALHQLNNGLRRINTIEDPIEYSVSGIRQSQVNAAIGLDFPDLLRSVLRQGPDVLMIGEIRDAVTAQTAVRAANSGHLVLATLHAPVAAAALQSLAALGVSPYFLANSLRGIITQRLVRVLCPECRGAIDLDDAPATFSDVRPWLKPEEGHKLFFAAGCPRCHQTGYAGRVGVYEVMPISASIRELCMRSASAAEIQAKAIEEGMIEFRRCGLLKVAQGITSMEDLLHAVPVEYLGLDH